MLYNILLFPARLALHFYCRKVYINKPSCLHLSGPLLLAANHPNSFLDAIIFATLFRKPVYSLARGDAFAGGIVDQLFKSMNMLPVYRLSEGAQNLDRNYQTFEACQHIFRQNGIVLIFSEGRCINEWRLRPLKKGTARLALTAWQNQIPLQVLPVGINYSSFGGFGKIVQLNFGETISQYSIPSGTSDGTSILTFNKLLRHQLKDLVVEAPHPNEDFLKQTFNSQPGFWKKTGLFLPAVVGYLLHAPLVFAAHFSMYKRAKDHYDSIMVGICFLFYVPYVLLLTLATYWLTGSSYSFFMLMMPFTALALLHVKNVFGFKRFRPKTI